MIGPSSHRKWRDLGDLRRSELTNPHLCRYCGDLFDRISYIPFPDYALVDDGYLTKFSGEETKARESFCHWPDFEALRESASNGCHLCWKFLFEMPGQERNFLEANPAETSNRGGTIELKHAVQQTRGTFEVFLSYPLSKKMNEKLDLEHTGSEWTSTMLRLRPSNPQRICNITSAKIRADVFSMYRVAESWISTCIADHGDCAKQNLDMSLQPARLIAVGVMEDFSDVRLCSASIAQPPIRYMTLSHCWGPQGLDFKLKSGLEADFFKQIPWQEIPQTFKDAVIVTRQLGKKFAVEHIWIDALCILQDSVEDWQSQSSIMGDVYRNSFCNLAACVGKDSHHSLFTWRNPFAFHDCIVRGGHNSSELLQNTFSVHGNLDKWDDLIGQSNLLGRAWVCQEVLTAPRVLYYTSEHLFWKCSSLCAAEPAPDKNLDKRNFSFNSATVQTHYPNYDVQERCEMHWWTIISMYTKGDLTRASDKLPAISGLARQMVRFMQEGLVSHDEYVAGLWRRNLHLNMLWRVYCNHANSRLDNSYAPTWSWASVQGQIQGLSPFDRMYRKALATIVAVDMEYITDDPFGQVKSGLVRIRAPLLQCEVKIVVKFIDANSKYLTECYQDKGEFLFDTFSTEDAVRPLFCLVIVIEGRYICNTVGLLLEKVPDIRGRYRRCGLFTYRYRGSEFVENAKTSPLCDIDYEERHEDGTCTVSII